MIPLNMHARTLELISLDCFRQGDKGIIRDLVGSDPLLRRLMDLGVIENEPIEVMHEAPFGKDPMAVSVRGTLLALRRSEAKAIIVQKVGTQ